jgi:flagellar motor switch protein FliN/FliY
LTCPVAKKGKLIVTAQGDDLLDPQKFLALLDSNHTRAEATVESKATDDCSEKSQPSWSSESIQDSRYTTDCPQELPTPGKSVDLNLNDSLGSSEEHSTESATQRVIGSDDALASLMETEHTDLCPAPEFNSNIPYEFEEFAEPDSNTSVVDARSPSEIDQDVCIELGRLELTKKDLLGIRSGSVLQLDKLAQDPVDILADGRLVARGEVVVLDDRFCIRVAEVLTPKH